MALNEKEISSKEQELDILFRSRRNEIVELEGLIKSATNRKYKVDEDIRDSQKELDGLRDKTKAAQSELQKVKVEAKNLKSEASGILADAKRKNADAAQLVSEKAQDLASLDRGRNILIQAKKQVIRNTEKEKELSRELDNAEDKNKELDGLIKKQKEVNSLKESLEEKEKELDKKIEENEIATKLLSDSVKDIETERGTLKSEIKRYSVLTDETLAATELLEAKTEIKNKEVEEAVSGKLENSEKYSQTVAKLEAKNRIVDAKEKKLDFILDKLKKNKKLTDDLKDIGL